MAKRESASAHPLTPTYTERTTCRACGESKFSLVLDLGDIYLINFVRAKDPLLPRAPLQLVYCGHCGLLQLKHQVDPDLMWRDYFYRSSINQTMRDALASVVMDGCLYAKEGTWLDIGANDGYLLSRVPERFTKVACEPALNMHPLLEEHADKIVADYFSAEAVSGHVDHFDCITSCAMFYDVNNPDDFVRDIASVLSPNGVWINQLSDAPTMLRHNAFDAICHEHACYYDVATLRKIYERHGLHIIGLSHNSVNGGSVRVTAMKLKHKPFANPTLGVPIVTSVDANLFAERIRRWRILMTELIGSRPEPLWVLGASTKGAVMLQYLDLNHRFVAIGDRNIAKYGTFQTGTWLPVVSEAEMRKEAPKFILNAIWAFRDEILERERILREAGAIIVNPLPNPEFVI